MTQVATTYWGRIVQGRERAKNLLDADFHKYSQIRHCRKRAGFCDRPHSSGCLRPPSAPAFSGKARKCDLEKPSARTRFPAECGRRVGKAKRWPEGWGRSQSPAESVLIRAILCPFL